MTCRNKKGNKFAPFNWYVDLYMHCEFDTSLCMVHGHEIRRFFSAVWLHIQIPTLSRCVLCDCIVDLTTLTEGFTNTEGIYVIM